MRRLLIAGLIAGLGALIAFAFLRARPLPSKDSVAQPTQAVADATKALVSPSELAQTRQSGVDRADSTASHDEAHTDSDSAPVAGSASAMAVVILASVRDELGLPIENALVRGVADAPFDKPVAGSNAQGVFRLILDSATTSVVLSAPGFRTRQYDRVADGSTLTLSRGIGIEVEVPSAARLDASRQLHVMLTPAGSVPWFRGPGSVQGWDGHDQGDGDFMQARPEFARVFGKGECVGITDETGIAHVVVSDPGEYEVRFVSGEFQEVTAAYDWNGGTLESLHDVTPLPLPHIRVGEGDEGRRFSFDLHLPTQR